MTVPERLTALRAEMKKHGIDAWLVPTDDFHSSEYVGNYFKCREFITGFTGSAGTALILKDSAYLWTDGRYFLQAADQLKDSGVTLMRMGDEGVPTTEEFIAAHLAKEQVLGFDGRCMTAGKGSRLAGIAKKNGASISSDLDLVGAIWEDRPALSCRPVWELDTKWTGKSRADKIADLREAMKSHKADYHVLTSLDDIAWLLNLRGDDVACNPVFLAYVAVTPQEVLLFTQAEAFADGADPAAVHGVCGSALVRELEKDHVRLVPYNDLYSWMKTIPEKSTLLFDTSTVNYTVWSSVPKGVRVVDTTNPTLLPKAIRTPVEMEHTREAHLKDKKCNNLCRIFADASDKKANQSTIEKKNAGLHNGVIIYSNLLVDYLKKYYPSLYLISSTTKVLTDFDDFEKELNCKDFAYVVPDFRLNKAFDRLKVLNQIQKDKVEFLCNECCYTGCNDRKACYENVSKKALGEDCPDHICKAPNSEGGYKFSKAMKNPAFISLKDIQDIYLPMGFTNFKIEGRSLGSALLLEFILYYMTRPEYQIHVREVTYLDNTLDLF